MLPEKLQTFLQLKKCISDRISEHLPGLPAQLKMAPEHRHLEIINRGEGKGAVNCAVLLLIYPGSEGQPVTVLMQRPLYDGAHSGQISFPGGRRENEDISLEYTALRETHEEIGVPPDMVAVAGKLTELFIPPSNFLVSPYIGFCDSRPNFVPDPVEVAAILEVNLEHFFNPANKQLIELTVGDKYIIETPCYLVGGHVIWGATAMMISEFVEWISA